MKIVAITFEGERRWGVLDGEQVLAAPPSEPSLLRSIRKHGLEALRMAADPINVDSITLLQPVPDAEKILCVGLNYLDHIAETGRDRPVHPVVFTRYSDSLVADGETLIAPRETETFDFEGELAVIIGREGRRIPVDTALDYVLGYSIINDGSVREFQHQTHQYTPGKNFDSSGAFGPWIVTADELKSLDGLRITTRLNHTTVQDSELGQLYFGVADLIARISTWMTLRPGDVIATGTPGGVGAAREPNLWMRPGDDVEVSIDGIGTLSNQVVSEDNRPSD